MTVHDVFSDGTSSTDRGLSSLEAEHRLAADGPNEIAAAAGVNRWRRLLGPFADPMVALLMIAAPTYALIGETVDALLALAALVPVAGVGWLLEARAQRTLDRLRDLTAPTTFVRRDGNTVTVRTQELVVGDVVILHEGDVVPADAEILDLTELTVNEAALTGESLPVTKDVDGVGEGRSVWAGTTVLSGRAVVRLTATGPRSRYGQIGSLVGATRPSATPLQEALARLVKVLAVVAAVFCAAVVATEVLRGNGWGSAVIAGVSLGIAAIPEEFSVVYALYLALGAWQLSKDRALVRRLPGVETLGSTTVICTDKTGTLTEGSLAVTALVPAIDRDAEPDVDRRTDASPRSEAALLRAAVLASEPDPFDPLDVAIVDHARAAGVDVDELHGWDLVADWPFDPSEKYLTHVWALPGGAYRVVAKGALDGILRTCRTGPEVVASARNSNEAMAADGMRVIAVATGRSPGPSRERATDELPLEFAGLVAFSDPVRDGVGGALDECRTAGVRVVMITGDHPATAHAIAESLGLPHDGPDGDRIATGDDIDAASDNELDAMVGETNIFARTRPDQKHRLVGALRRRGEVVAMTGDGVNDAAALQSAHIGIGMGERGTEVARAASTIVLLDDNFATIVTAIRNGRRIYDNLTRAFAYLIAFHPPLMLAALIIPLLDKPLLLLPAHLVLLELVLHPVVSVVFQADPADPDIMDRPPRSAASGLGVAAMTQPYLIGLTLAAGIVGVYLVALDRGWPVEEARSLGFVTLLCSQPFLIAVERAPNVPLWRAGLRVTPQFLMAVASIVIVTVSIVYVDALADLLHLASFPTGAWAIAIAVAAVTTLWSEPFKRGFHTPATDDRQPS